MISVEEEDDGDDERVMPMPMLFMMDLIQRINAKMPKMEPSVLRRLENCSATETIAFVYRQYLSGYPRGWVA